MTPQLVPLLVLIAVGGALGSMLRAALSMGLSPNWPVHWVTLAINLAGSLAAGVMLGALGGWAADVPLAHPLWVFGAVGLLGGLTTVSGFALQVHGLWHRQARRAALVYFTLSAIGCPMAAAFGWSVALWGAN